MLGSSEMAQWIPLVEYAVKKGVSLSTLRRRIKKAKVDYKKVGGKYLIRDGGEGELRGLSVPIQSADDSERVVQKLKTELKKAQEEIAELKMLVALYEDKITNHSGR